MSRRGCPYHRRVFAVWSPGQHRQRLPLPPCTRMLEALWPAQVRHQLDALNAAERRGVVIRVVLDPREHHDFVRLGDLSAPTSPRFPPWEAFERRPANPHDRPARGRRPQPFTEAEIPGGLPSGRSRRKAAIPNDGLRDRARGQTPPNRPAAMLDPLSALSSACASAISGISGVGEKPSSSGARRAWASKRRLVVIRPDGVCRLNPEMARMVVARGST